VNCVECEIGMRITTESREIDIDIDIGPGPVLLSEDVKSLQ
jgi:hypothetical protein